MYWHYNDDNALHDRVLSIYNIKMFLCSRYIKNYLGAIAISVIPLLADYVNHKSRGTCAAILVFMSSVGALTSAFLNFTILSRIDASYKIHIQYGIAAILILTLGLFYTIFCLKAGN